MGTFHWFDFIDHYYGDEIFDEKLADVFVDKPDEVEKIYDEIDKKIADIQAVKSKKWTNKFYKAQAVKFHPDVLNGDNEPMQLINKLKEQWGI